MHTIQPDDIFEVELQINPEDEIVMKNVKWSKIKGGIDFPQKVIRNNDEVLGNLIK